MADKIGKPVTGWTDREILVCLLNVMDTCDAKLDYSIASYPAGRNANGFRQKINALKRELQFEFEAIKAGDPFDGGTPKKKNAAAGTPKATPRKRKTAVNDEDGEGTPKKRGRPKKNVTPDFETETPVKNETEGDIDISTEGEAEQAVEDEI